MVNSGDTAWLLMSSALVMLMTPGLALFYGGMVRRKNVLSTIMMSFACLGLVGLLWVLYGYSLSFGTDHGGFIGGLNFLGLANVGQEPSSVYATTVPHLAFMVFQAMFAIITVALFTGAVVERVKFSALLVFSALWLTLVYIPTAHWVWGSGGWLARLGALDFAGGTVVHLNAGVSALALVMLLGRRRGFPNDAMEPNNIPMVVLGAGLLWFGWFGFNAGSALTSGGLASSAFVATNTAAAAAAFTWMIVSWIHKRPTVLGTVTGAVVGLVAITPAAGYVTPIAGIPIGIVAALISYYGMVLLKIKRGVDDSLDVFACHGLGGIWGALATGIFATVTVNGAGSDGLLYGNGMQVLKQLVGIAAVGGYAFILTTVLGKLVDVTVGLRVGQEEETVGLDISQHGERAYGGLLR
ncbi:MAG: ammonia channel protein [Chloroflexi bacterium RBG_16_56_11]|nr:MAG: ammonia channel protein [Chloroflexi bacterium RBG_16_56_11]